MHAIDITRHHFQPRKHYSGLLHFQGGVLLDSDQNESELIQQGEGRRILTDLLVTSGSPDDGMKIGPLAPAPAGYDFQIGAGVFYLGGLRLDVERPEWFRLQSEYLQMRGAPPAMPNEWLTDVQSAVPAAVPAAARTDLAWLETWEQAVTGGEDAETIETALEVESSARLRPMRKVHLFTGNAAGDCAAAFDSLIASLETGGRFTYDPETAELRSNRRLTVDFVDTGPDPDPCSPPVRRGFLGAENETIQIRVISNTRFAWSFGNAAPLYRVMRAGDVVEFTTPPRDELMVPLAGDLIELVRCDAILPNGQLIGERHGLFYRVASPYDPAARTVTLAAGPATTPFFNNTARADDLADEFGVDRPDGHLYARVWRGEVMSTAPIGKAMAAAPGTQLGNTGIQVSFAGNGPVGDSWTFSVRPNTPDVITPWEMRRPCPPTAPRRFVTALGLIRWSGIAGAAPAFHDCRRHIRKLSNASGCCEVTVGDNHESFGDVDTVAAALARLPASGGKICLLRGTHRENVLIAGRANVVIEGCGPLTRLLPGAAGGGLPAIGILDSTGITIRGFAIEALEEIAVAIDDGGGGDFGERTRDIRIEAMRVRSRDAPAILFNGGEGLAIEQCRLLFDAMARPQAAGVIDGMTSNVVLRGRDMRVERCRILPVAPARRVQLPLGGIHVMGGSERVEIRRNRIADGGGIGIVLGSVAMVRGGDAGVDTRLPGATGATWGNYGRAGAGSVGLFAGYRLSPDGCFLIPVTPPPPRNDDPDPLLPDADPLIRDCAIIENEIDDMGESGIAPYLQFDLSRDRQFCGVDGLVIRGNRIRGCARNEAGPLADGEYVFTGRGGVVLGWAEQLEFVDNEIEGCGSARFDPICGFFAAGLAHARIARNRIHDNGRRVLWPDEALPMGQRGGIVIRSVQPGTVPLSSLFARDDRYWGSRRVTFADGFEMQSGREALLLHENQVSSPEGRALEVNGSGAMSINDNQFVSLGAVAASLFWMRLFGRAIRAAAARATPAPAPAPSVDAGLEAMFQLDPLPVIMGNAVISVVNYGLSNEIPGLATGFGPAWDVGAAGSAGARIAVTTGRVLFADNQTRYDGLALPATMVPVLVGLVSLDDVKMTDNQCDADFLPRAFDLAFVHGCVIATTNQMANNRFSEPSWSGDDGLLQLSGVCVGFGILQHHNLGSHCFMAIGAQSNLSITGPNRWFVSSPLCERAQGMLGENVASMLGSGSEMATMGGNETLMRDRQYYVVGRGAADD